jgi:hypothetical protein
MSLYSSTAICCDHQPRYVQLDRMTSIIGGTAGLLAPPKNPSESQRCHGARSTLTIDSPTKVVYIPTQSPQSPSLSLSTQSLSILFWPPKSRQLTLVHRPDAEHRLLFFASTRGDPIGSHIVRLHHYSPASLCCHTHIVQSSGLHAQFEAQKLR